MSTGELSIDGDGAGLRFGEGTGPPRGLTRLGLFVGLFLIEVLSLTLRFDTASLTRGARLLPGASGSMTSTVSSSDRPDPSANGSAWLFGHASLALATGIAAASATLLFGGRRLREDLARAAEARPLRRSWPFLMGHLAMLAAFWRLTAEILEGVAFTTGWAWAWVVIWSLSGLGVAVALAAAAIPARRWPGLARRGCVAAAVGIGIALAAGGTGLLARRMWMPLGSWTLEAVRVVLSLTDLLLVYEPSQFLIGTESFAVKIAPECSGYEGIALVWAFLAAYLWLDRRQLRFPRAWLLLPLGTVAIWVANVLRIAALILVGVWVSPDIAVGGFHSQAGWLGFIAVTLGLILVARGSRYFRSGDRTRLDPVAGRGSEAVYLAPLLAIVAAAMIGGAFSTGGLDRYYPARLAAVALPLWLYRRKYAAMRWDCSWHAPAIGLLVFTIWIARWPEAIGGPSSPSMSALGLGSGWAAAWLAARVIGSALTVPFAEELAFRDFLTRRLIAADFESVSPGRFTWTSFLLSSVAFGVLHDRWPEGIAAGMLYALAYYRRGSLGDAVAAHATTNAMLCADALMTGDWSLFS